MNYYKCEDCATLTSTPANAHGNHYCDRHTK